MWVMGKGGHGLVVFIKVLVEKFPSFALFLFIAFFIQEQGESRQS
jgi:hypothetical protein